MTYKEVMQYINSRTYRQCSLEEAIYHAICLEGKNRQECIQYLNGII